MIKGCIKDGDGHRHLIETLFVPPYSPHLQSQQELILLLGQWYCRLAGCFPKPICIEGDLYHPSITQRE